MKSPHDVVKRALVTEKGTHMREGGNKYLFEVATDANKVEIKHAIEEIFSVQVEAVRTQNHMGKMKRLGLHKGRRPSWKRAIVTLKDGQVIELFEQV
jgi:large subunit ribosomal protein L23